MYTSATPYICMCLISYARGKPLIFFSYQNSACVHLLYMPSPSHLIDNYNYNSSSFSLRNLLQPLHYVITFGSKYFSPYSVLNNPMSVFLPQCQRHVLNPYKTTSKVIVPYISIFKFSDSRWEDTANEMGYKMTASSFKIIEVKMACSDDALDLYAGHTRFDFGWMDGLSTILNSKM
jgi:hypothetical protein